MTLVWTVLLALLGLYLLLILAATVFSLKPMRLVQWFGPAMVGLPQEDVVFTTRDGVRLSGWFSDAGGDKVVVCVHGYVMNRCEFAPYAQLMADEGWSSLFFDLRYHGKSGGKRVGLGIDEQADVEAAIDWVRERIPGARVVLFGSSMGGVSSAHAAAARPEAVEALMLDGAYGSLDEAIDGWWEFIVFRGASKILLPVKWIGAAVVGIKPKDVVLRDILASFPEKPVLLTYGSRDKLVPAAAVDALRQASPRFEVVVFDGSEHGQARLDHGPAYRAMLTDFLRRLDTSREPVNLPGVVQ